MNECNIKRSLSIYSYTYKCMATPQYMPHLLKCLQGWATTYRDIEISNRRDVLLGDARHSVQLRNQCRP